MSASDPNAEATSLHSWPKSTDARSRSAHVHDNCDKDGEAVHDGRDHKEQVCRASR
jgi:hypothetical protein